MGETIFTNEMILAWLRYYGEHADINLAKIKMLDITGRNKNLIPTVMANRAVLVFTDAGHPDIFYDMWNAELGDCYIWYNEGSEPAGEIKYDKVSDMIDRGINASAAMLILNPNAVTNFEIGMENERFSYGSVQYVCREVRAIIMSKLNLGDRDNICIVSGESIAVEAAMLAGGGNVIAVEYDRRDRTTMQENTLKFGLKNVQIIEGIADGYPGDLPVPDIAFIVASPRIDRELEALFAVSPKMRVLIYTLNFGLLAEMPSLFEKYNLERTDAVHVQVARIDSKDMVDPFPAPWLFAGHKRG